MRWRELIRSERGEIAPHARRPTRDPGLGYGFDPEDYPALADAADAWADIRHSPLKRWRLRLRSRKYWFRIAPSRRHARRRRAFRRSATAGGAVFPVCTWLAIEERTMPGPRWSAGL